MFFKSVAFVSLRRGRLVTKAYIFASALSCIYILIYVGVASSTNGTSVEC